MLGGFIWEQGDVGGRSVEQGLSEFLSKGKMGFLDPCYIGIFYTTKSITFILFPMQDQQRIKSPLIVILGLVSLWNGHKNLPLFSMLEKIYSPPLFKSTLGIITFFFIWFILQISFTFAASVIDFSITSPLFKPSIIILCLIKHSIYIK